MKLVLVTLTCANESEAGKVASALLDKKLAICIKQIPVSSMYLWKGKKEKVSEIMLLMETYEGCIPHIEKEVNKLHSYDTPVLLVHPILYTTKKVKTWVKNELL